MRWSKTQTAAFGLVVAGLAALLWMQHRSQVRMLEENQALQRRADRLQGEHERLTNLVAQVHSAPVAPAQPADELLRLRGEVKLLRQQAEELRGLLAAASEGSPGSPAAPQKPTALPADYPQTLEDATKGMFEALKGRDVEKLFTYFMPPGVPREKVDQLLDLYFSDEQGRNTLAGLELLSVGEPTNSYFGTSLGPNRWSVPCRIRLPDGSEKDRTFYIGQDPNTQKWHFLGGH